MIDGLKPYPAYKDPGTRWYSNVPYSWKVVPVRRMGLVQGGKALAVKAPGVQRPYLRVANVFDGRIDARQFHTMPFTDSEFARYRLQVDDVLLNEGQSLELVGRTARYCGTPPECAYQNSLIRVRAFPEVDPRFLELLFRHAQASGIFAAIATQTTSIAHLGVDRLGNLSLALPPLADQGAIVRFLEHAEQRIRRYVRAKQKLIRLLEEQKQAIIHRAVTRGLDPSVRLKASGIEWTSEVPEHWQVLALKRVLVELIDCEHKTAPAVGASDYRVARTTAIRSGRLHLHGTYFTSLEGFRAWTRRGLPMPGDVLFTREAPAGEACVIPSGYQLCLGQRTVLMKLRRDIYSPQFLVHMIYAGPPADRIKLASQGSTVGHFNMDDIASMPILAPPLPEQLEIVDHVDTATRSLTVVEEQTERELAFLREYRTRLIADVVTGKVDVREAAARLPVESSEAEPLDDMEALTEAHEEMGDEELDENPEEAEA